MIYALLSLAFVAVAVKWLSYEFKRSVAPLKCWRWLAAAIILQVGARLLSNAMGNDFWANIMLHSIGGGMAASCLFFYLFRTFDVKLNWRLQLVAMFMFVATLGTLNELAEFAGELAHIGKFSFDSHDTWRDLTSNTVGSLIAWLVVRSWALAGKVFPAGARDRGRRR